MESDERVVQDGCVSLRWFTLITPCQHSDSANKRQDTVCVVQPVLSSDFFLSQHLNTDQIVTKMIT